MEPDRYAPEYAWIKAGASARLIEDIPDGPRKGSVGKVRGTPDSFLKVPVNFGKNSGGEPLVLMTQIEEA